MFSFFQSQMDFILFYYGLAFLFVGLICFLIQNIERRKIPWVLLGIFAVLRGVYQWLLLMQFIFGIIPLLSVLIGIFYVVSFGFLFEFGRRGMKNKKFFGAWVYLPIGALLGASLWFGNLDLFRESTRYLFGFFGGFLCGLTLLRYKREGHKTNRAIHLILATVFAYIISEFSLGVNWFQKTTGFTIEFLRSILLTGLFFGIWSQYQYLVKQDLSQEKTMVKRPKKITPLVLFSLFFILSYLTSFFFISSLGNFAKSEAVSEARNSLNIFSFSLQHAIHDANNAALSLAQTTGVRDVLERKEPSMDAVNAVLDTYQNLVGDSVCYLMNTNGVVLATSNRNASDSFLGKNYAFRPYFRDAMMGKLGWLFANGITSHRPGYYAFAPVKNELGQIIGVVVVKNNLDATEYAFTQNKHTLLVSPEGVVLASGDPQDVEKSFVALSSEKKEELKTERLYTKTDFDPLFEQWPSDDSVVKKNGQSVLISSLQVTDDGWKIYAFTPAERIRYYRLFGISLITGFYTLLIGFTLMLQMVKRRSVFSYLASVIRTSQDAIIGKDLSGKILTWNYGAEHLYGYTSEEMIGKTISVLIPKDQFEKNEKILEAIRQGDVIENFEMKQVQKNGELLDALITISPVIDSSGALVGSSYMARDISRMKKIEKMRIEFVSIASHQLRTPLTGIKWFSELLLNEHVGKLNAEQKEYLRQIAHSNQRMINLVNDLLEVSHIDEAGKYKIDFQKQDFSEVIKQVVDQQRVLAEMKQIQIQLDPNCLKKNLILMDRSKIEQVLQNILNNAVKFSQPKGKIHLSCKKETGQLSCSVQDFGMGIPKHQQSQIFEKFFRADNAINAGDGTGLGLYIAKSIIEAHKGKIWFESKEGKGTTVYFSLPIV
ncbi:MAG: ATP-binding protein [Candidatus Uhrbacteria bacterium]|nr:ATP-binding protein [Candidatus Uhrbacteria bacterium]